MKQTAAIKTDRMIQREAQINRYRLPQINRMQPIHQKIRTLMMNNRQRPIQTKMTNVRKNPNRVRRTKQRAKINVQKNR